MPRSGDRPIWGILRKPRSRRSRESRKGSGLTITESVQVTRSDEDEIDQNTGEVKKKSLISFRLSRSIFGKAMVDVLLTENGLKKAGFNIETDPEKTFEESLRISDTKYDPKE